LDIVWLHNKCSVLAIILSAIHKNPAFKIRHEYFSLLCKMPPIFS